MKVVRTICSPDGVVEGAELYTENGMLKRPMNLLCPIEMDQNTDEIVPIVQKFLKLVIRKMIYPSYAVIKAQAKKMSHKVVNHVE